MLISVGVNQHKNSLVESILLCLSYFVTYPMKILFATGDDTG